MTDTQNITDEANKVYGAFGKKVDIAEFRQQIQDMLDPDSEHYHPWRAVSLMHKAIKKSWWDEQNRLMERGLPYRTDIPNEIFPAPFIDNGDEGIALQLADAYRHTFNYLAHGLLSPQRENSSSVYRHCSGHYLPRLPTLP